MKKYLKINGGGRGVGGDVAALEFEPGTFRSAVESSLIKNVNEPVIPIFLWHVGFNLVYRLK